MAGKRKSRGEKRQEADAEITPELEADRAQDSSRNDDPVIQEVRAMAGRSEALFPNLPENIYRGVDADDVSTAGDLERAESVAYWTAPRRAAAANEVAIRIAQGESIQKILGQGRDPKKLPGLSEFYRWMFGVGDEYVSQTYRLARQMKAEGYSDEIIEIADRAQDATEMAKVNGCRLAVETRQFIMSKLIPKMYGNQQGAGAGLTINISTNLGGEDSQALDGTYTIVAPEQEDQE